MCPNSQIWATGTSRLDARKKISLDATCDNGQRASGMARVDDCLIRMVIRYEDGTAAIISMDNSALRLGEVGALNEAYRRQRAGSLPKGKIKSVERA